MLTAGLYTLLQRAGTVRVQPATEGYLCDCEFCADPATLAVWEIVFEWPGGGGAEYDHGTLFHCEPCAARLATEYGLREASDV
jgi:hypothetical protein